MADKEATVYIVDVGKSMGECHNGRSATDLEYGMEYVWDRITATVTIPETLFHRSIAKSMQVATGRKTLLIGVLGLKTDRKHSLYSNGSMQVLTGQKLRMCLNMKRDIQTSPFSRASSSMCYGSIISYSLRIQDPHARYSEPARADKA